ncbi:MAG TPA: hypothetical protein VGS22_16010 [Thermoanaerobaculia bacterium]|jgi:hypothetical protein|nr:hypothetical protein [Thermoanaerobaculia bacterium]
MRISHAGFAALLLAALLTGNAVAQDLRGGELRINRITTGSQGGVSVAALPNGDFVAVWSNFLEGQAEVKARRFFADGRAKGGEISVARLAHLPTYFGSPEPRVAADAAGRFLVVWVAGTTTQFVDRVLGQRFDAAGRRLGPRYNFKALDRGQVTPDVAMTPDGHAVVVWQDWTGRIDGSGFDISDVYLRRLLPNGAFAGPVTLAVPGGETSRIAIRADGSFALATEIYNGEASFYDIHLSLYSADGTTLREPFEVNGGATEVATQISPAIAMAADGRMFVAWTDRSADFVPPNSDLLDSEGVVGQLIAADGSPIGENLRINTFRKGSQVGASVAATPNGGFLVAWWSGADQDGDGYGIFARQFAADGRRLGNEVRMNLARQGNQAGVALALSANGDGVAAWSGPDGDRSGVFARRLAPPIH